ncbi:MAG: hypothetical protein IPN76_33635 [Saprospiraceae bacterium]|nr:hypothetical protein [Saprospiraceae bacterium]
MSKPQYETKGPVLKVENLSVAYDGKVIIKDINFTEHDTVRSGKAQGKPCIWAVWRGKSTLFGRYQGLEAPTTGKVLVADYTSFKGNGEVIPLKTVHEGDVGFVDKNTPFSAQDRHASTAFRHAKKHGNCQ